MFSLLLILPTITLQEICRIHFHTKRSSNFTSHTSSVQTRVMENAQPQSELFVLAESTEMRLYLIELTAFHQVEALYIDRMCRLPTLSKRCSSLLERCLEKKLRLDYVLHIFHLLSQVPNGYFMQYLWWRWLPFLQAYRMGRDSWLWNGEPKCIGELVLIVQFIPAMHLEWALSVLQT